MLARAGGTAAPAAAAGWGGDAYALLGRGGKRALAVRWRWDSRRDAREFAAALMAWGDEGMPESVPLAGGAWRGRDGVAVAARRGRAVTLAIAPDLATAGALALPAQGR